MSTSGADLKFQSTLPRGERHQQRLSEDAMFWVSIHAPARGATADFIGRAGLGVVSIHAPARGATAEATVSGDPRAVSIHAPARGATPGTDKVRKTDWFQSTLPRGERRMCFCYLCRECKFQSTLPRGERHEFNWRKKTNCWFQSTLPRGERHQPDSRCYSQSCFNPRSRAGSDD